MTPKYARRKRKPAAEQGGHSGGIEAETPESIKKYCMGLKQSGNRISRSLYDALVQAGAKNIC